MAHERQIEMFADISTISKKEPLRRWVPEQALSFLYLFLMIIAENSGMLWDMKRIFLILSALLFFSGCRDNASALTSESAPVPLTAAPTTDQPRIAMAVAKTLEPMPAPTPDPDRPMVALTFDDGPTEYTAQVLDLLERYGAKGSFFVIGRNLNEQTRPILQRMVDMGCDIGMHDLTHTDLTRLSTAANTARIERMRSLISAQIDGGYDPHLLRPPFGKLNKAVRRACKAGNVASVRWCVDTRDWSSKDPKAIMKIVRAEAADGAIILFHDRLPTTVAALEEAIPWLQAQGYDLVTVTKLIESSGHSIRYGEDYQRRPGE